MENKNLTLKDKVSYNINFTLRLLFHYPRIKKDILNGEIFACSYQLHDGSFAYTVDFETPLKGMTPEDFKNHAQYLWSKYSSISHWYEV